MIWTTRQSHLMKEKLVFHCLNLPIFFSYIFRTLPESSFRNLSNLSYFSLADNHLEEIPRHIFTHMPRIVTMDLSHGRIKTILTDDFRHLNEIRYLVLVDNNIKFVEKESIPKTVRFLHLGRNNLTSLNGTLRDIDNMDVLFLNENNLTTLDGELPIKSANFKSLIAHHNRLQNLTQDLTKFMFLDATYLSDNEIRSLNGVFRNASFIQTLSAHNNKIEYLAEDEFLNTIELQELDLANNFIRALNNSLLPLKKVRICNISRNYLVEFSLNEVRGLRELQVVDLSYNYIEKLTGHLENVVDQDLYFVELRLDHNLLKSLDGALMNLNRMKTLDVSFNKIKWISSDDLIGLDDLESLDVSHNYLQTLEETSMVIEIIFIPKQSDECSWQFRFTFFQTFLPKLEKLYCSYNNLSKLERDFHGFPGLCFADLSNNHITHISAELVVKTRCNSHGVTNKLEILLQGSIFMTIWTVKSGESFKTYKFKTTIFRFILWPENPILCMDELSKLFAQMEAQETRLLGIAHCIVRQEEMPIIESDFIPPPPPEPEPVPLPVPVPSEAEPKPEIVPVVLAAEVESSNNEPMIDISEKNSLNAPSDVPSLILTTLIAAAAVTEEPIKETIIPNAITTTEMPIPNPDDNNVDIVTHTEHTDKPNALVTVAVVTVPPSAENDTVINSLNYIKKLENVTVLEGPPSTTNLKSSVPQTETLEVPTTSTSSSIAEIVLGEMESVSKSPEPDNYIYETFSPISPVDIGEVTSLQRNEHLVLAEEPPEILNDAVLAA